MIHMDAAMILCAGLGTRLAPLTDEIAKPMVPIGDRPAILHVAERVRLASPARIVINVHHHPEDLAALARREGFAISPESELLGTAGGLSRAAPMLGEGDVLVWNGDILSDLDPRELVRAHRAVEARATLAVRPRKAGEGNVGVGEDGRIVRLRDARFGEEVRGGEFLGIHILGRKLRSALVDKGCLVGDVYIPALARGERLAAHEVSIGYRDIGSVAAYLAANLAWLASRSLRSWHAKDAVVTAPIDDSVVGAGACVEAPLRRSVVWPGALVPPGKSLEDVVVTRRGTTPARPATALPAWHH
ncbi:MAG: sugar phosphate nucleotidyltransferase [Polyangiaceae bacterium]|nr:sugar phosphate nucleotidyltransferase [Polyangiaceae bacterium]